jgi:hypothetical protein
MAFDGNGNYNLPAPYYPAIPGTTIAANDFNQIMADIQSALSICLTRDGQQLLQGTFNVNGQSLSNVGNLAAQTAGATVTGNFTFNAGGAVTFAGSLNAVTPANGTNDTTVPTCAWVNNVAMNTALPAQSLGMLLSDGVNASFVKTFTFAYNDKKSGNIAAAATLDLRNTNATGNYIHIAGSGQNISAITLETGAERTLYFEGINTLVYSSPGLPLPGQLNVATAAGDVMVVRGDSTGPVIVSYQRASGLALVTTGSGGATSTASITLTNTSSGAIVVTPANPGLYAILPDATTCSKANNLFQISNNGSYDYGIKDNGGNKLGWIRPGQTAMIGLADKSTPNGTWGISNLTKIGVTAAYNNPGLTSGMAAQMQVINLDADRDLLLFGGTNCYGIVYNKTTTTWGVATLIRGGLTSITGYSYIGIKTAADQVMVCSYDSAVGIESVILTTSGTTITVNNGTKAATSLGGTLVSFGRLVQVGTSFVLSYGRNTTTSALRAITISGTTPTVGAESVFLSTTTAAPNLYVSGSIVQAVSATATLLTVTPYTVSGSTLSAGTSATATTTSATFRSAQMPNGRWILLYVNTVASAAVLSLAGTVSSLSVVTFSASGNNVSAQELLFIGANKVVVIYQGSGASVMSANIITDTAGTATAGSEVSNSMASSLNFCPVTVNGNNATFAFSTSSNIGVANYDCTGSSPVLSSIISAPQSSGLTLGSSGNNNVRDPAYPVGANSAYRANVPYTSSYSVQFSAAAVLFNPVPLLSVSTTVAYSGTTSADSWIGGTLNGGSVGIAFCHVEVV